MDTTTDMKKTNTSVTDEQAMAHVKGLLEFIGEDVNREGLIKTPHRVINAMRDHFAGYDQDPKEFLKRTFSEVEGYNELVVVSDIELHSHCEHHMVPFVGKAHVAYIPDGRVLGLSKIARVVDAYAKRLQVQEKLTAQIANAIQEAIQPQGVAVILKCKHFCMCYRGVKKPESWTTTSKLHGLFMDNPSTRMELFTLLGMGAASNG
ncbi:MAG: GTP cyclohydrolase I FolE [Phycisphaerales bacterium]|jgi:GTP cyclohydrolase I|nr:GTP cyclohydrolase I FolE [Phycisphaerales bacterium]